MNSRSTESSPIIKVLIWLLVNAIVPVLVPVVCIWGTDWMFGDSTTSFWNQFMVFMAQGYYIFSALTLFCSLFEDYKFMKSCASPLGYISMGFFLAITMGMFYYQYNNPLYLRSHYLQFFSLWLALVACAIYLKFQIVYIKK